MIFKIFSSWFDSQHCTGVKTNTSLSAVAVWRLCGEFSCSILGRSLKCLTSEGGGAYYHPTWKHYNISTTYTFFDILNIYLKLEYLTLALSSLLFTAFNMNLNSGFIFL